MVRWLGLSDRRSARIFTFSVIAMLGLAIAAAHAPKEHCVSLLIAASLPCYIGAERLSRSWLGLLKTLPELYEGKLRGGRGMSRAEKLLRLLCIGLVILAFYVQFAP